MEGKKDKEKIKILCDASYSKELNYASVGCSFEYNNSKYNFSKTLDFERYKENLYILDVSFNEIYSIFLQWKICWDLTCFGKILK